MIPSNRAATIYKMFGDETVATESAWRNVGGGCSGLKPAESVPEDTLLRLSRSPSSCETNIMLKQATFNMKYYIRTFNCIFSLVVKLSSSLSRAISSDALRNSNSKLLT